MGLYRIESEGETRFVEALSYGMAIAIWTAWARKEWECQPDDDVEADLHSVSLIDDGFVLRSGDSPP